MKVSNSYDRAAELLLAAGPASLLSSSAGAAPPTQRKSARPDRPHSGNFQRHHTYPSSALGGSGKTAFPPKPLPVNPTYRAACVETHGLPSLQAELAAMEQTPREQAMLHATSSRQSGSSLQVAAASTAREAPARHGSRDFLDHSAREPLDLGPRTVDRAPARDHEERRSLHQRVGGCKTPDRGSVRHDERHDRSTDTARGHSGHLNTSGHGRNRSIDASTRSLPARDRASVINERQSFQQRRGSAPVAREMSIEDDTAEYSDRFLSGYEKGRLLGKGACAVVWLAAPVGHKDYVAIKQVAKGNTGKKRSDTESARKEIFFGSYFFHPGGEPKVSASRYPGIEHIAKLLDYAETKRDIWLVMEYGGTSLTKMAYEIKGEFLRGERLYRVMHLPLLQAMKCDPDVLKDILRQLLSALCVLADHHIVHSDIKPDNILVEEDERGLPRARFIDLGSAFTFDCPDNLALATPEYMPPEALETCSARSGTSRISLGAARGGSRKQPIDPIEKLHRHSHPWSFDIWSLGSIFLELCLGTPLWLSYKCRVADDQRANSAGTGLFAVPGRDPEKIIQKQVDALRQRGLNNVLRHAQGVPINNGGAGSGLELLSLMLAWDPADRISPLEALQHPWLQDLGA